MNKVQQKRFDSLYRKHVGALKRQGKAETTIDLYSRALRRITDFFDCPPDTLNQDHFEAYFESLVRTHSWSTAKVDRNGLPFFYKYVLTKQWNWVEIVKSPVENHLLTSSHSKNVNVLSMEPASFATKRSSYLATAWGYAWAKPYHSP